MNPQHFPYTCQPISFTLNFSVKGIILLNLFMLYASHIMTEIRVQLENKLN